MSAIIAGQYRLYPAAVDRVRRVGASTIRVTFGGAELAGFAGGGRDQSVSVFLPHPGQAAPVLPADAGDDWFGAYRAMDPQIRAVMRSYTIRAQRPGSAEVDIDFVAHGDVGPASRWAGRARAGDRVVLLGPAVTDNRSVCFRPPDDTDVILLAADETALPAVGGILDWLPAGSQVRAFIEVPSPADIQQLSTAAQAELNWIIRYRTPPGTGLLVDAIRAAQLPAGTPYAWVAGESSMVRAVRRHLIGDRGLDKQRITFSGYWRCGASEDALRAQAMAGAAA